jgi:N-acetylneuraminic acid mutarotase
MRYFFVFASLICMIACAAAERSAATDLSDALPASVQQLPTFGTVTWTTSKIPYIPDGPSAGISGMGMIAYDGDLYLMGGFIPAGDGTTGISRRTSLWLHRYDPQSGAWTRLADMPDRREYGRATVVGDAVYFVGGAKQLKGQTPPYQACADVFNYNLQGQSWGTSLPSLSVARTHASTGCADGLLIVAGGNQYSAAENGYSAKTIQKVVEILDLDNAAKGWTRGTSIPGDARGWSATAVVGDKFYMLGGATFDTSGTVTTARRLKEALCYDPALDSWTSLTAPPEAISGWTGTAFQDRYILAAGGVAQIDGATVMNDLLFVYDTKNDSWLKFENPLPPGGLFNDCGLCVIGDAVYIAGAEGPNSTHYNYLLAGKITSVPEPGTIGLAACALLGLSAFALLRRTGSIFIYRRFLFLNS